ncbi:MerR family transcriptional regulator [Allonocardiopsis opalescens]|uniref:DNA-binding transcriptional MerR regulator n=1 Tax=Allonocardiopsis opalescens TaxID=1144618 RepID=A0A2T0Q9Z1_9ACTN|nr:MerR family transcriptional regulator [Allonocardiopsis opalescens]PRY00716.1 DNA-binding transcriptional MerR regulator [Allonocardiopsis opalescens]
MEWTIQQVAESAGVTSRTLRHYDDIGLLRPSRVGGNGYRYYDAAAMARLQRILLLRELGLSLPAIAEVLDRQRDEDAALRAHIAYLEAERARLDQRITAVRHALDARRSGTDPSLEMMLEGFNDPYRDDIVSRWGERVFEESNAWWHGKSLREQMEWKRDTDDLVAAWVAAWEDGESPGSPRAQALAARHVAWLGAIPGTPVADGDRERSIELVRDLGRIYVEDPNYAAAYGGVAAAAFVRDSLREYTRRSM